MADKPKRQTSVEEHAALKYPAKSGKIIRTGNMDTPAERIFKQKEQEREREAAQTQTNFAEEDRLIQEYNEKLIYNQLEDYKKFRPFQREVIIRCFVTRVPKMGNLFLPRTTYVAVPSRGYKGVNIDTRKSDWQFENRGIVVAVNRLHEEEFKPGDIIQVNKDCVIPSMQDKDSPQELAHGFWLSNLYPGIYPPKVITDDNYGYFKIPLSLVEGHLHKPEK